MKPIAPLLVLAALALCAPTLADAQPGHRHGREGAGEWRGGGGPFGAPQGEPPGGRWRGQGAGGQGAGGQGAGGRNEGPFEGRPPVPTGRWDDGRYPPRGGGQLNAGPRRGPVNSLGEGWREQQNEAREGVRSGELRPLGGVLAELRRRQPGRQLDAGIEDGPDGRPVYRVRWAAANGRRIDFIVDARTGAILAEEGR